MDQSLGKGSETHQSPNFPHGHLRNPQEANAQFHAQRLSLRFHRERILP